MQMTFEHELCVGSLQKIYPEIMHGDSSPV